MSEGMTYFCDVCGVQKRDANHWFKGYEWADLVFVAPWESTILRNVSVIASFPAKPSAHLCGEGHALEWASKVLSAKS